MFSATSSKTTRARLGKPFKQTPKVAKKTALSQSGKQTPKYAKKTAAVSNVNNASSKTQRTSGLNKTFKQTPKSGKKIRGGRNILSNNGSGDVRLMDGFSEYLRLDQSGGSSPWNGARSANRIRHGELYTFELTDYKIEIRIQRFQKLHYGSDFFEKSQSGFGSTILI